ncbi:hypothetical protein [Bdellovibrio sp. HCB209]|uniref:hypothetical protein n=1 Tax=Bdellovibrio sp. HCB209 TaxID=3394354 RepID=UPI0039B6A714
MAILVKDLKAVRFHIAANLNPSNAGERDDMEKYQVVGLLESEFSVAGIRNINMALKDKVHKKALFHFKTVESHRLSANLAKLRKIDEEGIHLQIGKLKKYVFFKDLTDFKRYQFEFYGRTAVRPQF